MPAQPYYKTFKYKHELLSFIDTLNNAIYDQDVSIIQDHAKKLDINTEVLDLKTSNLASLRESLTDFLNNARFIKVYIPLELSESLYEEIRATLTKDDSEQLLEFIIQPELIGGLVVSKDGKEHDFSIKKELYSNIDILNFEKKYA